MPSRSSRAAAAASTLASLASHGASHSHSLKRGHRNDDDAGEDHGEHDDTAADSIDAASSAAADEAEHRPRKRRITAFLQPRTAHTASASHDDDDEDDDHGDDTVTASPSRGVEASSSSIASTSSRRRSGRAPAPPPAHTPTPVTLPPTPSGPSRSVASPATKRSRRGAAAAAAAALAQDALLSQSYSRRGLASDEDEDDDDDDEEDDDRPPARHPRASQSTSSQRARRGAAQLETSHSTRTASPATEREDGGDDDHDTGRRRGGPSSASQRSSMIVRVSRGASARRSTAVARAQEADAQEDAPDAEAEGGEDDAEGEDVDDAEGDDDDDADGEGEEADDDEGGEDDDGTGAASGKKKRTMRFDGVDYPLQGDSLVLPSDPAGDTKVDDKGRLQGDRTYKFPVFQLPNRADPEKLYVLSIDAARSAGYRDSLYFYRNNKRLLKVTLTTGEKDMLIARGRLSMQLRTRNVTATSVLNVYKTHGARVVKGGRAVTDDYYEAAARASGRREGERVRVDGGRDVRGDADLYGGSGGLGADLDGGGGSTGLGYGSSTSTLASTRNKRVDSNVHSFPDPLTGQPLLTIFGDAGLSPWVRIEEGPRAGQAMRRKMLANMDIDGENWMREAAHMVVGMNRELEDGRRERLARLLPGGRMRPLADEVAAMAAAAAAAASSTTSGTTGRWPGSGRGHGRGGGGLKSDADEGNDEDVEVEDDEGAGGRAGRGQRGSKGKGARKGAQSHGSLLDGSGSGAQARLTQAGDRIRDHNDANNDGANAHDGPGGFMATYIAAAGYGPPLEPLDASGGRLTGPVGVYEPLTGVLHVPLTTQPTRARWERVGDVPRLGPASASSASASASAAVLATRSKKPGRRTLPTIDRVSAGFIGGGGGGTRLVGSSAWGIASVGTELVLGPGGVEGEGVAYRIVPAGASEGEVGEVPAPAAGEVVAAGGGEGGASQ